MGSRPADLPIRRINIGLDFGTSTTKVVVRIDEAASKPRFLIVGPSNASGTVLFASTVAVVRGEFLLFGYAAEESTASVKARSFKMNLPAEAGSRQHTWRGRLRLGETGLSAEDVSTLYLAWVLKDVLAQVRTALNGADIKVTVNAAAPLDQLQQEKSLRDMFHRVVFHALRISHLAMDEWPLDAARRTLNQARRTTMPPDEESPISVFPETHAAMTSYMLLPGRGRGNYATVDVGAGSSDVAFFWFHATDGQPEMCYYGALSDFVGMDDVDRAVASDLGNTPDLVRAAREDGQIDLAGYSSTIRVVLDNIYKCYRMGFGRSYARCLGESKWRHDNGHARYTLCLVGGGCLCQELVTRLSKVLPILNMKSVDVEVLGVPGDLAVLTPGTRYRAIQQIAPGERPLLLLAHGLANRAVDIPAYQTGYTFGRVRELKDRPTHEELYAR